MEETRAEGYGDLAVNGHLAAALEASEELCSVVGLRLEEVADLHEHLWSWMTVDESTFTDWNGFDSRSLRFALGGEVPRDLAQFCDESGIDADVLRTWFSGLVEIVYAHLFATVRYQEVIEASSSVFEIAQSFGVRASPASRYRLFGTRNDFHGWGTRLSPAQVAEFRSDGPVD